ncbi:MAG: hypothetical protein B6241_04360 [Spirochaetaceae bacterium 4572_59]|nr:MAG: hypothetical protein B6241_04360 [Spirochaetaceae bacterium 4572_59]
MNTADAYLIILGNQAGDLDSTVCTLSLASLLSSDSNENTIPLLRGVLDDFRLKPEIPAILDYAGIKRGTLIFDYHPASEDGYFLVDHNIPEESMPTLPVRGIIDHHMDGGYDVTLPLRIIESCGSCASLVCREWYKRGRVPDRTNALLLAAAIIVDTGNFDPQWGKTTEIDTTQFARLEKLINSEDLAFLKTLPAIKNDLHHLSACDHLKRDYKDIRTSQLKGGITTVPLSIKDYFSPAFYSAKGVEDFIQKEELDLFFIMHTLRNPFGRELSFKISPSHSQREELENRIKKTLCSLPEVSLVAADQPYGNTYGWFHYRQKNSKASRKILLPLINGMMEEIGADL